MRKKLVLFLALLALPVAGAAAPAAEAYVRGCGYGSGYYVSANQNTSCGFAFNVARLYRQGQRNPYAYSPATGRYYKMYCYRASYRTRVCTGGNNAYVRLRR